MKKKTIVIVDDHEIVRKGLCSVLMEAPDFEVVGEAENGQEGLDLLRTLKPDIALIDIRMKKMNGTNLCRIARQEKLKTALVILTSYANEELIQTCLQLGVQGYLMKDTQGLDLLKHIRTIMDDGSVLDPQATKVAMKWIQDGGKSLSQSTLGPRDIKILGLIAEGLTNREIGRELYLSENTIKTYIIDIYRSLKVKNRIEAVVTAYRQGIL